MAFKNKAGKDLIRIGFEAADILGGNEPTSSVYKTMGRYLFNELIELIDMLRFYVIDEQKENLREEIYCFISSWSSGYDFIPLYQLPREIIEDKDILRSGYNNMHFLKIPLCTEKELLGLLEFRTFEKIDDKIITEIREMADIITYGLANILLKIETSREKENAEKCIKINDYLQTIDDLDELCTVFMELSLRYFRFDRISIFLFNDELEIEEIKSMTENGREFVFGEIPEIPDLSLDYIPLDIPGFWFPLRTTKRIVGAVLFDNIYTLYKIPSTLLDTLSIVCSQFAITIDNICMYKDLQKSAFYDFLTGLYNRNYLEKILPEYSEHFPLSVIMGDLNGLKLTNDIFGHSTGDELLKRTAGILKESLTEEDIVVRSGGDEFLVLLPGKDEIEAKRITQLIKRKCFFADDLKVQLSISLGYASRKSKEEKLAVLITEAENKMYRHKLLETKSFRRALLSSLRKTLEEKCHETFGHVERMAELAIKVGVKMNLTDSELDDLRLLAILHDMGKVVVKDEVLNKPGPLTDEEWEQIKKHPEVGYRIAHASYELSQIANYILYHHEKWDGTGYPLGKKGEEIPLLSRIISVVDAYDVMTHHRPYKKAISHKEALKELNNCTGTQFAPEVVKVFCSLDFNQI